MNGCSRPINAITRRLRGAWRLRRLRGHRRLRLLHFLGQELSLELAMLAGILPMVQPLLILQSPCSPR